MQCVQSLQYKRKGGGGHANGKTSIAVRRSVLEHIRTVAGPSLRSTLPLTTDRFFAPAPRSFSLSDVTCPRCQNVVDEPIELPCKSLICYNCCVSMLRKSSATDCPSCHQTHQLSINSSTAVSPVVMRLLSNLVICCEIPNCNKPVLLQHLGRHIESGCKEMTADVESTLTVGQVLEQPHHTQNVAPDFGIQYSHVQFHLVAVVDM